MEIWHMWLIFALFLGIVEFFLPGLTVICLAGGAAAAAYVAWAGGTWVNQLGSFSIVSLMLFFLIRPLIFSIFPASKNTRHEKATNVDAIIGQKAWVIKQIPGREERGWVKVADEEWAAISKNREPIALDHEVTVSEIEGNTLIVVKGE